MLFLVRLYVYMNYRFTRATSMSHFGQGTNIIPVIYLFRDIVDGLCFEKKKLLKTDILLLTLLIEVFMTYRPMFALM